MGNVLSWIAHQGIVRVLSVPAAMALLIYLMYVLAMPPPWSNDEDGAV